MPAVILKIGGSSLGTEGIDAESVNATCSIIKKLKKNVSLGVVVGAGKVGGSYVNAARQLNVNEFQLDSIAIDVSRLNAKLLARGAGIKTEVPTTVEEASKMLKANGIVVMGGTTPGHTTNTVAALLAEDNEAKLINVTRVGGIFDKDPGKNKDAKKLSSITPEELIAMATKFDDRKARTHFVFDLLASKIIARSKIPTCIINSNPVEIENACMGKAHSGTIVE
ncbi:UMP kinase [archaeon]|nr:UMP kinase [archaeon]